ncbi:MAG: TAT-variant-translocated molybdopterin oxidoreductase [Cytophagales bacterium]
MGSNKKYWKGVEELNQDPEFLQYANKEFPEYLPVKEQNGPAKEEDQEEGTSRRDFLKLMGFSVAAASLVACEAPVRKAIPYLNKPEDVDPGIPNYYASTYAQDGVYASILVKTREGRPIFVEGNKLSSVTSGALNARAIASVLDLYSKERLTQATIKGEKAEWDKVDADIISKLNSISASGGRIALVGKSDISPSSKMAKKTFSEKYGNVDEITYDVNTVSALADANKASFGTRMVPSYDFSKANVIVGINADFLGTWISPVEFSSQYARTRKLGKDKKNMSRHYQFESLLTLTGSNADYRSKIKPSEEASIVKAIYEGVSGGSSPKDNANLSKAISDLKKNKGKSLLVSGSNDLDVQMVVNEINNILGNYGATIDTSTPVYLRQGNDMKMANFIADLSSGIYSAVIFTDCNPVYDHPNGAKLSDAIKKAQLSVSTSLSNDETASVCNYVCPSHHYLESWNDAEPKKGHLSLTQPTISPLFSTRQTESSLMKWSEMDGDYYDFIKKNWESNFYPVSSGFVNFDSFWDRSLHDGVFEFKSEEYVSMHDSPSEEPTGSFDTALSNLSSKKASANVELLVYENINVGSGAQGNNPWLHECPDPITKVCYDNYVSMSITMAGDTYKQGDLVKVSANGHSVELPVLIQPGQANNVIGIAYGFGRSKAGRVGNGLGKNAYPFISAKSGYLNHASEVTIEKTGGTYKLAQTQTHETVMGREFVVQETVLSDYQKNPSAGKYSPKITTYDGHKAPDSISLWKGHEYPNHHWGLAIDLNSCTGCSACIVSCFSENNIPMVGKDEVIRRREMHWLRIDRYYSTDADLEDKSVAGYKEMEQASDNPEVVFQPMMCQQCNNAPCETVCPVAATTHSTEGLNQMTYNRCIGTRYCANNCPYKVRRFNWFKYHDNKQFPGNTAMNNDLGKMVLNPDVTVRSRGVMEKCTFCVQRIQSGKLAAKKELRKVEDGEVTTACASACPTEALVFGDMKDPNSRISNLINEDNKERAFHALEELTVLPNVTYLRKVRNKDLESKTS